MSEYPQLPECDEALLKQCTIETYRSSGPGGQHVNTTDSAVRVTHYSGLVVACSQYRSQHRNKEACLSKLRHLYFKKFLEKKKVRIPTKKSYSSVLNRLQIKKNRSDIKKNRQKKADF